MSEASARQRLKAQIRRFLPRAVRPRRILFGRLRGYRIVTSWHDYPSALLGRTEGSLLKWFDGHVKGGETWLDVGAHYGYTAIALCRLVGASGRVFAFEPEITTAGYLARLRELNHFPQLIPVPLALGDSDGLELAQLPVIRGMVDRTVSAAGRPVSPFLSAKLDWLWQRICGTERAIHGIKIDVQGAEIDTLRGMAGLLREFGPQLVLEVHRGVDRRELLDVLESVGYSGSGRPIEQGSEETAPRYLDDRSYWFTPHTRVGSEAS